MLQTQTTFMESCKLLELDVIGNTTIIDSNKLRNTTGPDGTVYTERKLFLSVEFLGGLFMKIDQKPEYTGQFKAAANGKVRKKHKNLSKWSSIPQYCTIYHFSHWFFISFSSFFVALSLMAELGGYLGLFLGYSLMQISGPLTLIWIQFR